MGEKREKWPLIKYLITFSFVAVLFPPEGIAVLSPSVFSLIWQYGRYGVSIIIMLMFITNKNKEHVDFWFLLIPIYVLIDTLLHNGSVGEVVNSFWNAIMIYILLSRFRFRIPEILSMTNLYLLIICCINMLCIFLWPNGMYVSDKTRYYQNWILGYKSSFQYFIFPCVFISWLEYEHKYISLFGFVAILSLCFMESIAGGNTMLTITILIIILVSIFRFTKFTYIFNPKYYFYIILVVNALMIFLTSILLSSSAGMAFLTYFNKGNDLGGRVTKIWPTAIEQISKKPLFGYGMVTSDENRILYRMSTAIHSHNQLLEFTIIGGIVLLLLFLGWLFFKFRNVNILKDSPSSRVIGFSMLMIFLMTTVEIFSRGIGTGFWMIIFLADYIEMIDAQYLNKEPKARLRFRNRHLFLIR